MHSATTHLALTESHQGCTWINICKTESDEKYSNSQAAVKIRITVKNSEEIKDGIKKPLKEIESDMGKFETLR
jgi:hypothetical protein